MEENEYSEQLRQLGTRFVNEGARVLERYAKAVTTTASGEGFDEEISKSYVKFAQKEGSEYIRKLMQCNIDYYIGLMNAGLDFSNGMIDSINKQKTGQTAAKVQTAVDESISARAETGTTQTELHFTGEKGISQSQAFMVANNQTEEVDVSFEISEFISEDGKVKTRAPVNFKPDHFTLSHGAEQIVECQVTIDKTLVVEQQNVALARVVGFPDMMLRLIVIPHD